MARHGIYRQAARKPTRGTQTRKENWGFTRKTKRGIKSTRGYESTEIHMRPTLTVQGLTVGRRHKEKAEPNPICGPTQKALESPPFKAKARHRRRQGVVPRGMVGRHCSSRAEKKRGWVQTCPQAQGRGPTSDMSQAVRRRMALCKRTLRNIGVAKNHKPGPALGNGLPLIQSGQGRGFKDVNVNRTGPLPNGVNLPRQGEGKVSSSPRLDPAVATSTPSVQSRRPRMARLRSFAISTTSPGV